jgi:capsular exopolysaccharide synthesis family protein
MPKLLDAINKAQNDLNNSQAMLERDRLLPVPAARTNTHLAPTRINSLRNQVLRHHRERGVKIIMLTGAYPDDGTTTTAVSLATTLSMDCGLKILLTDADIQSPKLHDVFKTSPSDGLTDPANNFAGSISGKKVGPGELYFLPAGKSGHAGDGYFDSRRFLDFLGVSRKNFDFVILDTAPVLSHPDSLAICSKIDGVIIVIAHGKVRRQAAQRLKAILENAGANLLGVVVNRRRHYIPEWIYNKL